MAKHLLSKSTFIRGTQCGKALFLNKHFPALKDPVDEKRQAVFNRGHAVGETARQLFPGGMDAFPGTYRKTEEWIENTASLITQRTAVIYEAAFLFNDVMVAVDILVRHGEYWRAYEVKSSARISAVYLEDAALQYYVITGSGIQLEDFSLVHINTEYVRAESLDLNRLFSKVSVKREISSKSDMISGQVEEFKQILLQKSVPNVEIGEHCHYPYPCDFLSHCRKHLPAKGTIFDLGGKSMAVLYQWFHAGKIVIRDLGPDELDSRDLQIQANAFISGKEYIEKEPIHSFLSALKYPLVFLDFETCMPAIPMYKGTHPYEQIPFQFSAHRMDQEDGKLSHTDFVAQPGTDPRREFAAEMLKAVKGAGTILAYNATFERMIMKQCALAFPEMADEMENAIAKMADLMEPFKKKWYYHPGMKGSASIKTVLPALVPGLSYEGLTINNGAAAMGAYESLSGASDLFSVHETIEALKEYCKLDTLAMVKLLDVLKAAQAQ